MKSFESQIREGLDMGLAQRRAEGILSENRIQLEDFTGVYPEEKIATAKEKVEELERLFAERETPESARNKQTADILEAIMLRPCVESNPWFGESAHTIGASKYDDYVNGVDMVVELQAPEVEDTEHLALGIDVTFTDDTTKKFDGIRESIDKGKLTTMEFFSSDYTGEKDSKPMIPKVVVGVDTNTFNELAELWMAENDTELRTHRVQIMVLKQIEAQLEVFSKYAEIMRKGELVKIFDKMLIQIRKILDSKRDLHDKVVREIDNDTVHRSTMDYTRRWGELLSKPLGPKLEGDEIADTPLTMKESAYVQRDLVASSGISSTDWVGRYAKDFTDEVAKDPEIRRHIRTNREKAIEEIEKQLIKLEVARSSGLESEAWTQRYAKRFARELGGSAEFKETPHTNWNIVIDDIKMNLIKGDLIEISGMSASAWSAKYEMKSMKEMTNPKLRKALDNNWSSLVEIIQKLLYEEGGEKAA